MAISDDRSRSNNMIHKFCEVLHQAEDLSFESGSESLNDTEEMILLGEILGAVKGFVDTVSSQNEEKIIAS